MPMVSAASGAMIRREGNRNVIVLDTLGVASPANGACRVGTSPLEEQEDQAPTGRCSGVDERDATGVIGRV